MYNILCSFRIYNFHNNLMTFKNVVFSVQPAWEIAGAVNTKNQIEMWILKTAVFAPQLGYHLELYPGQTLNIHVCNPMKKLYA